MFGTDYYPEHWQRHRWKSDARLMSKAGIEIVRLGEFAWEKIEPDDGVFDFTWLDEAIDVLGSESIRVVLGTPTAAPPAWLVEKHPEILPVRHNGARVSFGGRHHNCHSNDIYRESVEIVVRSMATHYRDKEEVIGWQIDNELGNSHENLCFCDSCKYHFRAWLQRKYGSIDALNEAWGTVFWSQSYTHFFQIPLPVDTPNSHNPALLLDWRRFASDLIVDFQRLQLNIIREECPEHFVTHNLMGFFEKVNYFDLTRELSFASHDQYPLVFSEDNGPIPDSSKTAMPLDFVRGLKHASYWVMEQQSGPAGWEIMGPTPRPGQLRLWSAQSIAHGADTVVYFRWRSCLFGTEQYWHGILPHSGDPGRRYEEVIRTIRDLKLVVEQVHGQIARAHVAFLFSYDQLWALRIQPHHPDLSYVDHMYGYYRELHNMNVPVDFVSKDDDLNGYNLVFAPMQYLITDELSTKIRAYIENGGRVVADIRTGVKDWNNRILPEMLPGPFARLFGLHVVDYDCLRGTAQYVRWGGDESTDEPVEKWADVVELNGATALATFTRDYYRESPAVTEHTWEDGTAYYIATELGRANMRRFVSHVLEQAGIRGVIETPEGVEAVVRPGAEGHMLFVLNHTEINQSVSVPTGWKPVITPEETAAISGATTIELPPFDIAVLTES